MGRVKLEIKKIENTNNRLVTFAKRKTGLIKKAQELSTLCDIDVALIMFSPGNKLTQYATNSRIEEILFRYANVPEAERAKRKIENLEQLNRAIRKLKGDNEAANLSRHFLASKGDFVGIQEELRRLQTLNEIFQRRLRLFQGDESLLGSCNYDELLQMEMEVQRTMDKVNVRKMQLEQLEQMSADRSFQHDFQYMGYSTKHKEQQVVDMAAFGECDVWTNPEVKYLHGEEAAGSSELSSSPGSYFGDQARSSFAHLNLNQVEFHNPLPPQLLPPPPGAFMCGFDLGFPATLPYNTFVHQNNNLDVPTVSYMGDFQQEQKEQQFLQQGETNGYMDPGMLVELASNSQVDSSQ